MRKSFFSVSIIAGTIIGAGIFSLPFVFRQIGFFTGIAYLLFFCGVYALVYLMYARLLLNEPGRHEFLFVLEKYLSKLWSRIASFSVLGGILLALLAYLTLIPSFSQISFGFDGVMPVVVFWAFGSAFLFFPRALGWAEFLGTAFIATIVGVLFVESVSYPFPGFSSEPISIPLFFLPFGPLLFSFSGRSAVSEVVSEYKKSKEKILPRNAVILGVLIPAIVYLLFVVSVLKLDGNPSQNALSGLLYVDEFIISLLGALGIAALFTSYVMLARNLKDILTLDEKFSSFSATIIPAVFPIAFFLLGLRDFFSVLSFSGGVFVALESIFIVAAWRKAFPKHRFRWATRVFYAIFISSIVYACVSFFEL